MSVASTIWGSCLPIGAPRSRLESYDFWPRDKFRRRSRRQHVHFDSETLCDVHTSIIYKTIKTRTTPMNDSAGKLRSSWRQLRCEPALPGVANRSAARTPLGTSLQRLDQARSAKGVPAADGNRFTHQAQADATLEQASRKDVGTRSLLLLLVHTPPRLLGSDPSSHRLAWRVVAL